MNALTIDFAIRMKHWSVLTDAGLLHLYLCSEDGDYSLINPDDFLDDEEEAAVQQEPVMKMN